VPNDQAMASGQDDILPVIVSISTLKTDILLTDASG
jgi:hypothetical protein